MPSAPFHNPLNSQTGFGGPAQTPYTPFGSAGPSAAWGMQTPRKQKPKINLWSLFGLIGGCMAIIVGIGIGISIAVNGFSGDQGGDNTANGGKSQSDNDSISVESSGQGSGPPSGAAANEIVDDRFGFRFTIPTGFSLRDPPRRQPNALYSFATGPASKTNPPLVIGIQRLRGTIDPHQRLSPSDVPQTEYLRVSLAEPVPWEGHTLDVLKTRVLPPNVEMVAYTIQFPLPDEAVQLVIGGPTQRNAEIQALVATSVDGFKNLRPLPNSEETEEKSEKPAKDFASKIAIIVGKLVFAILLVAGGAVAIVISVRKLRKSTRKQTRQPHY